MAPFLLRFKLGVAAILAVLLVTNTSGFSLYSSNLWPSRRLMHYNFNHGNWLALTSTGVRQAKSTMFQRMSTPTPSTTTTTTTTSAKIRTTTTSQSSAPHRPQGERISLQHVIYEQVDRRRTVSASDGGGSGGGVGHAADKLPITQEKHLLDGKSRSGYLIASKPPPPSSEQQPQRLAFPPQLATENGGSHRLRWHFWPRRATGSSWNGRQEVEAHSPPPAYHSPAAAPSSSATEVFPSTASTGSSSSTPTSRNSHRAKRNLPNLPLGMSFQEVQIISQRRHKAQRWMALNSQGLLTLQPDDSNDTQFLLAKNDDDFTTAIYSPKHKKFICFSNATGDVIAQDCFERSMCGFNHSAINNVRHVFFSVCQGKECVPGRTEKLILGFKKNGLAHNMKKYKADKKRKTVDGIEHLGSFQFLVVDRSPEDESELHRKYSDLLQTKSCANIWLDQGERIFKNEINHDPDLECILKRGHAADHKSLASSNCTKEKRASNARTEDLALVSADLSNTTTMPTPGTTMPSALLHQRPYHRRTDAPCVRWTKVANRSRKVRHHRKKSRSLC